MRIAVVGIGGVGGYYGGRLANAFPPGSAHEVLFYCRGAHLDAIRRNGLKLVARDCELVAHPALATDAASAVGRVDVAVFAVKGYSLPDVARELRSAIGPSTVVIPLGNGVNNDEVLRRELHGGRVLNGGVYISTHIEGPGVVVQTGGSRKLFFGPSDGVICPYREIEAMLKSAGIDAMLSNHILRDVWTKFILIDAISAVTSLHGATIGGVLTKPELKTLLIGLMSEVRDLSARLDVGLPENIVEQAIERAAAFPPDTKTSMQLDVEKKTQTELETTLGYVVRKGRELGVPVPVHEQVHGALSRMVQS